MTQGTIVFPATYINYLILSLCFKYGFLISSQMKVDRGLRGTGNSIDALALEALYDDLVQLNNVLSLGS